MWPAMNLFLDCGHLTARRLWCGCTGDGEFADAHRTRSCLLAFYRKKLVAGDLESLTFKIHFVMLVKR